MRILKMKMRVIILLALPILTLSVWSCGEDDIIPLRISADECVVSVDENPNPGKSIGQVEATTTRGDLSYEIMTQDPADAIVVNPTTGEITVGDTTLFDYEERPFTTAMIMVSNEDKEEAMVARVNILNVFENPKYESIVGHFSLDAEAIDLSDFGNDGAVIGALPTTDIRGDLDGALMFDGVENMVVIPHKEQYDITNELTISALVNVSELKDSKILRKGGTQGSEESPFTISIYGGVVEFNLTMFNNNGGGNLSYDLQSNQYDVNEWTLVTCVLSGDNMYLYLNGQLVEEGEAPGELMTNEDQITIGDSFKGAIDDLRIYDVALMDKEVKEIYNNYSL